MSNVVEFPNAGERELRKVIDKAALAFRLATCCRRISDKAGGNREVYERACASLNLWCIPAGGLYLALPADGRSAGFDDYGRPAAHPLKPKRKDKASLKRLVRHAGQPVRWGGLASGKIAVPLSAQADTL